MFIMSHVQYSNVFFFVSELHSFEGLYILNNIVAPGSVEIGKDRSCETAVCSLKLCYDKL